MSKREILLSDLNPDTIVDEQDLSFNKDSRKKNKYRAEPVVDEIWGRFDSTGEYNRWLELLTLQEAGEICFLSRQDVFVLVAERTIETDAGIVVLKGVTFKPDFQYLDRRIQQWVVEDYKGMMTRDSRLRIILFMNKYPNYRFRMSNGGMQHITRKERKTRTKKGTGSRRRLD
jgi:hypothetical protein